MNFHHSKLFLLILALLLSACTEPAQPISPSITFAPPARAISPPTSTEIPKDTPIPAPTEIPTDTPTPAPTQDPTIFGAISQDDMQAFLLEPIVIAIFTKVMDGFIANGNIIEYRVTSVTVFPSSSGDVLAEVIYNVRTTDTSWLLDGGAQAHDDWINNNCSRFDFLSTETEFQLKNRRLCS